MKLVVAIINPMKLEDVRDALADSKVTRFTVSDVKGYGHQRGHTESYRGVEQVLDYRTRLKLEIAVADDEVETTISTLRDSAGTGAVGDGKIWVVNLEEVVRIRTGETGDEAI